MKILARCLIFLMFLLHPSILGLADSKCQESSDCGLLGTLKFPFSIKTKPKCGLFLLDYCQDTLPRIQLEPGGIWYDVLQKKSAYAFRVRDTNLSSQLNEKHACEFIGNRTPADSPFSWSTVSPALQVVSCGKFLYPNDREEIDEFFKNYRNYSDCDAFTLYYKDLTNGFTTRESRRIPKQCAAFDLPLNPDNQESVDLFQLASFEYDLELNVSTDCISCHSRGGKCSADRDNGFLCEVNRTSRKVLLIGGVAVTVLIPTFIFLFFTLRKFILLKLHILQKAKPDNEKDLELFLKKYGNLALTRYKYSDLKKMTNSFCENLGKGGYGSVYKGKLSDGRLVAVKILNESKGSGEEFLNEVASISRTSHVNIVTLLGFCFQGSERALIYEFMPNGSLEKFIHDPCSSSAENQLGWEKLFDIAVGIARGLDYLHRGCNMRIVHFDIKPHNILLDKDFNPKISDFGLAKLCPNRSSIVSMLVARGTIGYIAPEVFCGNFGGVSHKSDVYSYGMMALEIAGGKKNIDPRAVAHSSEMYFPQYIYKQLETGDAENLDGINVDESESQFVKRRLLIVGLWCIQTDPRDRPSMSNVVDMLEGKIEPLQVPPKPYLSSPSGSTPSSWISETM